MSENIQVSNLVFERHNPQNPGLVIKVEKSRDPVPFHMTDEIVIQYLDGKTRTFQRHELEFYEELIDALKEKLNDHKDKLENLEELRQKTFGRRISN